MLQINETYASQVLAITKELRLDTSKVNVEGGALALGHPIAATGARMVASLVHQMRYEYNSKKVAKIIEMLCKRNVL